MVDLGGYFNRFPQIILGPYSLLRRKNTSGFCTLQKSYGMVAYRIVKKGNDLVCEIYTDLYDKKKAGRKRLDK